jgi:hypothetical protein
MNSVLLERLNVADRSGWFADQGLFVRSRAWELGEVYEMLLCHVRAPRRCERDVKKAVPLVKVHLLERTWGW